MISKQLLKERSDKLGELRSPRIYAMPKNTRIAENVEKVEEVKVKVRKKK